MNTIDLENYERLTRVRDFHGVNSGDFAPTSLGIELFTEVNAAVADLTALAADQAVGLSVAREATTSKSSAVDTLRAQMARMNRTAHSMAVDNPAIADEFRMPAGTGVQALLNAARAFLANATPLSAEFIRHELPATFLADLQAAITAVEETISERHQNTETHVEATAGLDSALERGLKALRKLDGIVRNKYHDDDAKLAAWLSASRRRRHRKSPTPPPPPAPPHAQ